jgi:glutamine synthetase
MDGIRRRIDPSAAGFGPLDVNIFKAPAEVRDRILSLPASLEEALAALERDSDFLLPGDVFPVDFVRTWVDHKIRHEVTPVRMRPHPLEIDLYFDL